VNRFEHGGIAVISVIALLLGESACSSDKPPTATPPTTKGKILASPNPSSTATATLPPSITPRTKPLEFVVQTPLKIDEGGVKENGEFDIMSDGTATYHVNISNNQAAIDSRGAGLKCQKNGQFTGVVSTNTQKNTNPRPAIEKHQNIHVTLDPSDPNVTEYCKNAINANYQALVAQLIAESLKPVDHNAQPIVI
jgi:hypothetical protein